MDMKKIAARLRSLVLVPLVMVLIPAVANASTISIGDGIISELGSTITMSITLDSAPSGLSGYVITVMLSDQNVAEITRVSFPSWASMTDNSALPAVSFWIKAADLNSRIQAGATNIDLGTLTIRGNAGGECVIDVTVNQVDDDNGYPINPSVRPGTLIVGQYDLTISSMAGGSVTDPGEGAFTHYAGAEVDLVASPAPGYEFAEWTGDVGAIDDINAASTTITMAGDYSIIASFVDVRKPYIAVSATWIDFGNVVVGSWSFAQLVTIANDGLAALHVGMIVIDGMDAGQFAKRNDNCSGQTILPGGSATLEMVFNPTSTERKSAALTIPSDDPDEVTVTVTLGGAGVIGPPSTVTLTAFPINLLADGACTSTITATVKDVWGNNVADDTRVTFATDQGSLENGAVTATTLDGVATATLTASTESGIATVRAQVDDISDCIAVFFKQFGQPDVIAAKTESTGIGMVTVDAKDEANTAVTKSGEGTPTITVARYEDSPYGFPSTLFAGEYISVHLDATTDVDEVAVCFYYPIAVDESNARLYWWDEVSGHWVLADVQPIDASDKDDYGVKVCILISATGTIPALDDLQRTLFFAAGDGMD